MDFSLNRYILNEALSSNILKSILNEPTGFFKLSKLFSLIHPYKGQKFNNNDGGPHDITQDMLDIVRKLNNTLYELFYFTHADMIRQANNTRVEVETDAEGYSCNTGAEVYEPSIDSLANTKYDSLDDNELVRINKEYRALLNQLYSKAKNIMNRPDPAALFSIINRSAGIIFDKDRVRIKGCSEFKDLLSLTDSNFKKYTITELKGDKAMQEELQDPEKNTIGLYFSSGGSFCGASACGQVILHNPFIEDDKNAPVRKLTKHAEYIIKTFENPEFYFPCYILRTQLHNSTRKLTWPVISVDNVRNPITYQKFNTFQYITKYLSDDIENTEDKMFHRKSIGGGYISTNKIISTASNLRRNLSWGYDKNDYVWVLRPYGALDEPTKSVQNALSTHREELRNTYKQQPEEHYKWVKDSLFRMQPYRVGSVVQMVTVFDKDTQTYKNYKVTRAQAERMMNNDGIEIVFSNNPDTFVEIARHNIDKRKMAFRGKKAIQTTVDKINSQLMKLTKTVAENIAETEKRANKLKQCLRKLTPEDAQLIKHLLFSSKAPHSKYEELFKNAGFEPEEYQSQGLILGGFGVQYKINRFITDISNIQHLMNQIIDINDTINVNSSEWFVDDRVKRIVQQTEDIKNSINLPQGIDLQLDFVDKILARY